MKLLGIFMMLSAAMAAKDKPILVCRNATGCEMSCNPPDCHLIPRHELVLLLAHAWRFKNVSDEHAARYLMNLASDEHDRVHPDVLPILVPHKHIKGLLEEPRFPTCEQLRHDLGARDRDEL